MKTIRNMNEKELFYTAVGSYGVIAQAMLANVVKDYKAYCEANHMECPQKLSEIVAASAILEHTQHAA